jgi:hypothetical protein
VTARSPCRPRGHQAAAEPVFARGVAPIWTTGPGNERRQLLAFLSRLDSRRSRVDLEDARWAPGAWRWEEGGAVRCPSRATVCSRRVQTGGGCDGGRDLLTHTTGHLRGEAVTELTHRRHK